jgi:predicted  nucleic acid-binding Zn-ribbon protein
VDTAIIVACITVVGAIMVELLRKVMVANTRDHATVVEKISELREESQETRRDLHDLKGDVRELKNDHRGLKALFSEEVKRTG